MNFKEECITLRKKGHTLPEIVLLTRRPKSSVYTHIRTIPLSPSRLRAIRKASGDRIRQFPLARKGKSLRTFRTFVAWTPSRVLLVAHLLFDGEFYRGCIYNNRSEALIRRVERCMKTLYDFAPRRYTNPTTGVRRISYHNVALGTYLEKKGTELLARIERSPRSAKRLFLRAFFDDEGCMDYRPATKVRKVRGYQKDKRVLRIVYSLLRDFSIGAYVQAPNEVVIVGKENLLRFQKEINFSLGVYINGNRTNSRWKKHLEKRELLRRAIVSFQR